MRSEKRGEQNCDKECSYGMRWYIMWGTRAVSCEMNIEANRGIFVVVTRSKFVSIKNKKLICWGQYHKSVAQYVVHCVSEAWKLEAASSVNVSRKSCTCNSTVCKTVVPGKIHVSLSWSCCLDRKKRLQNNFILAGWLFWIVVLKCMKCSAVWRCDLQHYKWFFFWAAMPSCEDVGQGCFSDDSQT
jgi:hypothetical protein